jgi:Flp pilus assembly protein TadG
MRTRKTMVRNSRGQSMLEAILMMPLMLGVVLNAVNLGYFFFVTVNLTGATRTAAEYSVIGPNSPGTTAYPPACNNTASCPGTGPPVTDLLYKDLTGAVANATSANVTVCSPSVIVSGSGTSSGHANCVTCTSSSSGSCSAVVGSGSSSNLDPGNASYGFVLNHIEVKYSFRPLIPGTIFNLILLTNAYNAGTGQYTFYRRMEMRAM